MKPTVCQVVLSLGVGGAEVLAARISAALSEWYRFVFVCLEERGYLAESLSQRGIEIYELRKTPGFDWSARRKLASILRSESVDVVHAHQYGPFVYSALARGAGRSTPIVFTEHGRFYPDPPRLSHRLINPVISRSSDRIIGVGEHVREALIRIEGFSRSRVAVIRNGIPQGSWGIHSGEREVVRKELGVSPSAPIVIMVARLDPIKDHSTAIEAISVAREAIPEIRLLIVGDGPAADSIDEQIARLGLHEHVIRLGLRTDVARLLAAADIALLTSVSEGIPLFLIEAMASGLSVVATHVGGVPEVVLDGATGLLAPSGDFKQLGAHLVRLSQSPEVRAEMGAAGQERARTYFSEEPMVQAYENLYQELIGRTRFERKSRTRERECV